MRNPSDASSSCRRCRGAIAFGEPIVVVDGQAHETLLLRERIQGPEGDCFHRACFWQPFDGLTGGSAAKQGSERAKRSIGSEAYAIRAMRGRAVADA